MSKYIYPGDFIESSWKHLHGDYYVSVLGDDVNGDGSPRNPFKTIQQACDVANERSVIIIGAGQYSEQTNGQGKSFEFWADGPVEFTGRRDDGTVNTSVCFFNMGYKSANVMRGIQFRDFSSMVDGAVVEMIECRLINCTLFNVSGKLERTLWYNGEILTSGPTSLINCTLINVRSEEPDESLNNFKVIANCHFGEGTNLALHSATLQKFDYCNQAVGATIRVDNYSFDNPINLRTFFPKFQKNGISELPHFRDPEKRDFTLKENSLLRSEGENGNVIGAYNVSATTDLVVSGASMYNAIVGTLEGDLALPEGAEEGWIESAVLEVNQANYTGLIFRIFENFDQLEYTARINLKDRDYMPISPLFEMRYASYESGVSAQAYKRFRWNHRVTVDQNNRGNGETDFQVAQERMVIPKYVQLRISLQDAVALLAYISLGNGEPGRLLNQDGSRLIL